MPSKKRPDPELEPLSEDEMEALVPEGPAQAGPYVPMLDLPSEPTQEGFSMSDDPPDDPLTKTPEKPADARSILEAIQAYPGAQTRSSPPMPSPTGQITGYESRIQILEAFQYLGSLSKAPPWIDRNWIGFADYDEVRKLEACPCLRVPLEGAQTMKICRMGDYVVRQSITLARGVSDIRMEVWERADFERFFLPTQDV